MNFEKDILMEKQVRVVIIDLTKLIKAIFHAKMQVGQKKTILIDFVYYSTVWLEGKGAFVYWSKQGMEKKLNRKTVDQATITRHQLKTQPVIFKQFYFWQPTAVSLVRDSDNAVMQGGRSKVGNREARFGLHVCQTKSINWLLNRKHITSLSNSIQGVVYRGPLFYRFFFISPLLR